MITPGTTSTNYKSSFFSAYHPWFCRMGYPRVDLCEHDDGSWSLIELQDGGYIPAEAKFMHILIGVEHLEPSYSTLERLLHSLDIFRGEYLDVEMAKSAAVEAEWHAVQRKRNDLINRTADVIAKNDGLKERIARRGARALDLIDISRYVPRYRF